MNKIKITKDVIYNEKIKKDIIIKHIADIHFNINTNIKKLNKIAEEIIKDKPNYIMITGDIIDTFEIIKNRKKIKELISFLVSLTKNSKVLISLGNHDIYSSEDHKFFQKISQFNHIYLLDNDSYSDDLVYVCGFTLPTSYYYNIKKEESELILLQLLKEHKKLLNRLPNNKVKICLIHSPIRLTEQSIIEKLQEFDIILSGHMHNGMVLDIMDKYFPKNKGIIAPNKNLFPEFARGKKKIIINGKELTFIITGGITKLSLKSSKILSKLNYIYNISINKIIITKKRGIIHE